MRPWCFRGNRKESKLNDFSKEAAEKLIAGGIFYVCELHPFKQYAGSKARFTENNITTELEVYIHNISDYFESAISNGLKVIELKEWFDGDDHKEIPRLISFVFQKE